LHRHLSRNTATTVALRGSIHSIYCTELGVLGPTTHVVVNHAGSGGPPKGDDAAKSRHGAPVRSSVGDCCETAAECRKYRQSRSEESSVVRYGGAAILLIFQPNTEDCRSHLALVLPTT
jgi:hypothetical protein